MDHFIASDGVEIAYQTWGSAGPMPPVVLHHGFIANANLNWVLPGIVAALTDAGRQVAALDARGHGASGKPHDPSFYGEGKMAQDLRQLFDIIGTAQVDLVGYSMGAVVSLLTASQEKRIRRMVVGGVGGMLIERSEGRGSASQSAALVEAMRIEDPATITDTLARSFRAFADRVGSDREALAAQLISRHTAPIALKQITAPTLLIVGDKDPLAVRPELLVSSIADARLLQLEGDHLSIVSLSQFAEAIVEFLAA